MRKLPQNTKCEINPFFTTATHQDRGQPKVLEGNTNTKRHLCRVFRRDCNSQDITNNSEQLIHNARFTDKSRTSRLGCAGTGPDRCLVGTAERRRRANRLKRVQLSTRATTVSHVIRLYETYNRLWATIVLHTKTIDKQRPTNAVHYVRRSDAAAGVFCYPAPARRTSTDRGLPRDTKGSENEPEAENQSEIEIKIERVERREQDRTEEKDKGICYVRADVAAGGHSSYIAYSFVMMSTSERLARVDLGNPMQDKLVAY
ncbi:hypothetical protein EVAR_17095_1 [Eumeta japonica]|uniref:Uncharacterized protein n=1 Tax=Eumeta variegata TaxID=151549 RepID=A0A4C1V6A5_EUMVA|nr:hypothetical protein EVAR_17095_1 [Eumeta japonica]